MSNSQLRKEAYQYILEILGKPSIRSYDLDSSVIIPLNELMLLKDGLADPSATLVGSLKQMLKGTTIELEINTHLVVPFKQHK